MKKKAVNGHRNRSQCRLPLQFRRTTGTVDQYRNWHSHYPLCAGKSGLDQPILPPFGRCYSERAGESAGRQRRRAVRVRVLCSRKPPARSRTVSSSWPIVGRTGTAVDPRTVTVSVAVTARGPRPRPIDRSPGGRVGGACSPSRARWGCAGTARIRSAAEASHWA